MTRKPDLSAVTLSGGKLQADLTEAINAITLDYSTGSVAQLVVTAQDASAVLRSALVVPGSSLTWRGEPWQVGGVASAWGTDATIARTVTCRSRIARGLRRTYKVSAERKVSPSEWVRRRVQAAGGTAVCQASSKRATIAQTSGDEPQSELDVVANLAGELDWDWVEWGGRLWFGSRYWAWSGLATGQRTWAATWRKSEGTDALSADLAVDDDDTDNHRSGSITLPYAYGSQIRPWDLIQPTGFGSMPLLLVEQVSITADGVSPVTVQVAQPVRPRKRKGST